MEEKLHAIIIRIENSKLSDEDKAELYVLISEGLESTVQPILLKHMDKNQLEDLSNNPGKVTVESYGELMKSAILDGAALKEIDQSMNRILARVDTILKGAFI